MFRYIAYFHEYRPGFQGADPRRFGSLSEIRDAFQEFASDPFTSGPASGTIYGYGTEEWESAQEFAGIGTPFDYPWKVIERGPRGGIRFVNA